MMNVTQGQASKRVSERARERTPKVRQKRDMQSGWSSHKEKEGEREGEGERKTGLSVRCRSKQEVNKANESGTPSLAKGRSESAAKGQQSE